jgi:hypothetical protein
VNALSRIDAAEASSVSVRLPIGERAGGAPLEIDLDKLMVGRCLIQGSSGAGKSQTIRRVLEEAFEYLTVMIVDPEGEFENLARHVGATTIIGAELAADGLTAAAARGRHHRLPLHLDLSDLAPDERISKAAAFFAGLLGSPREGWANTVLVAIDEAHLLAPHLAATSRDAEVRRLGVSTLTELCARGRKRGISVLVATQRLAKLASSVTSELHNALIGLNVFDRDVARAADILGFSGDQAQRLRLLEPGEFFAFGPALSRVPVKARIGATVTMPAGAAPQIQAPADISPEQARALLALDALQETGAVPRNLTGRGAARAIDGFLLDPAAGAAIRIIEALRPIAPNATTSAELARALSLNLEQVDQGLDLLLQAGAVDAMPRGDGRIARLAARLRLRSVDANVVSL